MLLSLKSIAQTSYLSDPYHDRRNDNVIIVVPNNQRQNTYVPPVDLSLMERVLKEKEDRLNARIQYFTNMINDISELVELLPMTKTRFSIEAALDKEVKNLNSSNLDDINNYNYFVNRLLYIKKFTQDAIRNRK